MKPIIKENNKYTNIVTNLNINNWQSHYISNETKVLQHSNQRHLI